MWSAGFSLYFMSLAVLGTSIILSSSSWLGVWVGFEVNLLGFTPILFLGATYLSEVSMKYFLIQTCGSFLLLMGGLNLTQFYLVFSLVILIALFLKGGIAPFHFWYPSLAGEVEWFQFYLLSTLQKVGALVIIFYASLNFFLSFMYSCAIISGVVGGVGGILEVSLRKLLAYSSINHLGWMLLPLTIGSEVWMIYFFIYCVVVACVVYSLNKFNVYHMSQMTGGYISKSTFTCFMISLFSLGGFPPLLGFLPKWLVLELMSSQLPLSVMYSLLLTSVITLFYYMRGLMGTMFLTASKSFFSFNSGDSYMLSATMIINMLGLWIGSLLILSFLQ